MIIILYVAMNKCQIPEFMTPDVHHTTMNQTNPEFEV